MSLKTIVILLLVCGVAHAAPSISGITGTISDGNSVVISGSDFTTKATAAPIRYDEFDSLTTGEPIASETGWWTDKEGAGMVVSTDNQRHSNSTKNAKAYSEAGVAVPLVYKNSVGFSTTGKGFISAWVRWDWGTVTNEPDGDYQIQMMRPCASVAANGGVTYPDFANFNWFWDGGTNQQYIQNHKEPSSNTKYFTNGILTTDKWHHYVLQFDMGTAEGGDGNWKAWLSIADFASAYDTIVQSNVEVLGVGGADINAIKIDNSMTNVDSPGTGNFTAYWDDIYIDNVWNRVEIGDNSTYSSCTHREVQPPTAWSTTEITVTLNQGSFANDSSVYVYVIDANGDVSASYGPVTVGGTSSPPTVSGAIITGGKVQ